MVLVENLGDDLCDEYVVINIGKDVRFIEQIKKNVENQKNHVIIKAWGKAISLGVKLALQAIDEVNGLSIGHVSIGTEPVVEIPVNPRKNRYLLKKSEGKSESNDMQERVTRAMSWIEIPIEKT